VSSTTPSPFLVSTKVAIMCLYLSSTHTVVAPICVTPIRVNPHSRNATACSLPFLLATFPMANAIVFLGFASVIAHLI